jgi:hypothetical protein
MYSLDDVSTIYVETMDTIYGAITPYVFATYTINVKPHVSMQLLCVNFVVGPKEYVPSLSTFSYNLHIWFYLSLRPNSSFFGHPMIIFCYTLIIPQKESSLHPCFRASHVFDISTASCIDIVCWYISPYSIGFEDKNNKKQISYLNHDRLLYYHK